MKKILLAGILILLLFVATAAAVSVNYAQTQGIPLSTARDNANSALLSYVAQGKLGSSTALWKGASLSQTPIIIYDQSGVVYSYLFDVINKDGTIVGLVNAAGNKLVGMPVVSIEKSPRSFDPDLIIPKVRGLAEKEYADAQIDYVVFIMGQDQKIGVMVILTERNGLTRRITYDIQTFKLQSERISYPGLLDASTPTSVFVSMSSSSANRAILNYDSKTKSITRVIPVMRRVIPVNYLNTTNTKVPGVSTVKSVERGIILSDYKSAPLITGQMPTYTTTRFINLPIGKTSASSSTIEQPLPASRFYPV
jgi:hypothetical protein